jgi:hypothetical protein
MVKNPFRRHKVTTLDDKSLATQLREEGGLQTIWGSMHLQKRLEFIDEAVTTMLNHLEERRTSLLAKKEKLTTDEKEQLAWYDRRIEEWILYRAAKKSAVAWQTIWEDHYEGERWRALELQFARNEGREAHHALLMACLNYMPDLSFKSEHIKVPSPIVIHSQIIAGSGSLNPNELIEQSKTQTTKPPH